MDPVTKTWVSLGLVPLALFEFWSAMQIFGKKVESGKRARLMLLLHRIGGYVFLVYFIWICWVCLDLMSRLAAAGGYDLDARGSYHGFLAITLLVILLLKISFVRIYRNYRQYIPLLGIIVSMGTVVLWCIAGLIFLFLMSGVTLPD
jgi:hypothetical protein